MRASLILSRDALYCVAKQINDKATLFAFSTVCKTSAIIVKQLRPEKDAVLNHIAFKIGDPDTGNYCDWFGKYTRGNVSVRGTRLWFLPNAATCIENEFDPCDHTYDSDLLDDSELPGDVCNIRFEFLDEFIEIFEQRRGFVESGMFIRYLFVPSGTEVYYYYFGDRGNVWVVHLYNCILNELKRVMKLCIDNNIEFRWI